MKILSPSKHSHPDKTVMSVATVLLRRLKVKRIESFDSLRSHVRDVSPGCDIFFVPAVSFLFILGLVEYSSQNDSFIFQRGE